MEWIVIIQCVAAMAAFRAAEPDRLERETGISPGQLGWRKEVWRREVRAFGAVLVAAAFGLAWWHRGLFEAVMLVSAATMVGGIAMTLLAPVARRVVWSVAATCLAVAPVSVVVALVVGGGHGG